MASKKQQSSKRAVKAKAAKAKRKAPTRSKKAQASSKAGASRSKTKPKTKSKAKAAASRTATKKKASTKSKAKAAPKKQAPKKKSTKAKKSTAKKAAAKKTAPAKKTAAKKAPANKNVASSAKTKTKKTQASGAKKSKAPKNVVAPKQADTKPEASVSARAAAKLNAPLSAAERRKPRGKMLPKKFLVDLAQAIKDAVSPVIAASKGREVVGTANSGDATFELDQIAEKTLLSFLKNAKLPVAYYSEDSGYTTFTTGQPTNLLVVDPIDGTRAARYGFEGCVVSVCSTRIIERPTIADVDNGCVLEIMGDRVFYAEREKGARIYIDNTPRRPRPSSNTNLETMAWSMTVPARPAELIFPTAARLIDLSSLKGGFFSCNSSSFSLTRLVSGQLDACVDFANRFYRDIPTVVEDHFINAGRGAVLGICPYDFAAAILIAQESGCVVTDAYGRSFDDVLLLDSSDSNHRSLIAAANPELHEKLMSFFDTRVQQFENLLKRKAGFTSD